MKQNSRGAEVMRYLWEATVVLAALVSGVAIPLRLVLAPSGQSVSLVWDVAVTLLFGADLVFRLRRFIVSVERTPMSWWWLTVDVLATLPLGRALGIPAAHLVRLVKLLSVVPIMGRWRRTMILHPTVMRLAAFAFWLGLLAHWLACGWILLGGPTADIGSDSHYLSALYWCVTTLTTVGYGDVTPTSTNQTIYTMTVMLLGVGVYGFVIGNVANLLGKIDMARAQYVATIERLTGFMRYRRVPAALQREIYAYYKYLWENRMGYDEATVLNDLPPSLRAELSLVLKRELIEKVDFLRGASPSLIQDLSVKLRPVVYTPGDTVVRAGELGRHVYFISKGSVEVVAADGETVIRTLSDGDFFGELALIHTERRTATVRALSYCDFYVLDKETFARTLTLYPEFAESIQKISDMRVHPTDARETSEPDEGSTS